MSDDVVIRVENLGKSYQINHQKAESYTALRDVVTHAVAEPFRRLASAFRGGEPHASNRSQRSEEFWALKDVSFEVKQGEVLGIIGRNGAGKSTLLKILSRITEPSQGRIQIKGRVASLLEVGTGFHPELTGRENVFLNGAILGMSRAEIRAKFDEIVAFAEVEKFLDTPVKRYSSGMYVRLAFAVAAHLEPEILIVDEVLAVGDAEFQKKCLGKMEGVAKTGRTVLLVSHNHAVIEQLCSSVACLINGGLFEYGHEVRPIINRYLGMSRGACASSIWRMENNRYSSQWFSPHCFSVRHANGTLVDTPVHRDAHLELLIEFNVAEVSSELIVGFWVLDERGTVVFSSWSIDRPEECWPKISIGRNLLKIDFPTEMLHDGVYRVKLSAGVYLRQELIPFGSDSPEIQFELRGFLAHSRFYTASRPGIVSPRLAWEALHSDARSMDIAL